MTAAAYVTQELGQGWLSAPGLTIQDKKDFLDYARAEMAAKGIPDAK